MAGKTAILAVRIISSADGKGFRKAAREVDLFNSRMSKFGKKMAPVGQALSSMARATASAVAPLARFAGMASSATVAVAGLAVPIVSVANAAGAALGPIIKLGAALAPAVLGAGALAVGALSMAFKGMGEAMTAADPAAFAEAVKDMGPAATAAATELNGMASAFREIGRQVQESFWSQVSNLGDLAVLIAPVGDALDQVAVAFGKAASGLIDYVSHGTGLTAMKTLISESATVAGQLGEVFADVVRGIIAVGAAAAPVLTELTRGMAEAASGWADRMNEAFADGSLQQYFQDALATAREFGAVMGEVGGIVSGVWQAMSAAGQPMLGVIREAITATNAWVNSAQGMSMMTEWFTQMGAAMSSLMPIFGQLAQIIIGTLAPAIAGVIQVLAPAASALVDAFGQVLAAIAPILGPLSQIVALIGETLAGAITAVMPIITQLADILTAGLSAAFAALQPVMPVIVDAFAQLAAGMQPLMPAFEQLVTAVVGLIPPLADLVASVLPQLVGVLVAVVPVIAAVVSGLASFLESITPLISIIGTLVGGVLAALAAILRVIAAVISPVIQLAVSLGVGFGTVMGAASRLIGVIGSCIGVFGKLGGVFGSVIGAVGRAVGAFSSVSSAISGLIGLVGRLIGALSNIRWPKPPGWLSAIFAAPEDPTAPRGALPSSYGQFAAGDPVGFLRLAHRAPDAVAAPVTPVTVNVNVRGAVLADEFAIAEAVEKAFRHRDRADGRQLAGGRRR
jgi:phage-related protein